jgi:hypothetical protein
VQSGAGLQPRPDCDWPLSINPYRLYSFLNSGELDAPETWTEREGGGGGFVLPDQPIRRTMALPNLWSLYNLRSSPYFQTTLRVDSQATPLRLFVGLGRRWRGGRASAKPPWCKR